MTESASEHRMAENEVLFRSFNERVKKSIDRVNQIAAEDGQEPIHPDEEQPLYFYCECADENCQQRIWISPREYDHIHKQRNRFTIVPGHVVKDIEDVTTKEKKYWIVTKHQPPPQHAEALHITPADNT